jgi:hypothetical protein
MAIFMPVTSNESQSFLTKVENPSQILNFITGGNNRTLLREQQIFGSYYFKDDIIPVSMSNESKKRLLCEVEKSCSNNANDSDSDVSVGQEKIDDNKTVNNYQKMKTKSFDNSTTSTRGGDDDDNSSNESSSPRFGFNNSSSRLNIPINQKLFVGNSPLFVTGGNPTGNLQEEILRNSQVYAGELMRHQLAAAAQLQSLSGVQAFQSFESPMTDHHSFNFESSDSMTNLQDKFPRLFSPKKVESNNFLNCNNKSAISFQNIHSHLSAITQITNSFTSNNNSMKKDDVTSLSSLSRESSQSPSGFQQFKQNQHFATHQNNLTDRQLKFSIDNILKADFGRRITEPLLRSSKNKKLASKIEKQTKLSNFTKTNNNESISPIESSINNAEKSPTSIEKNQGSSETSSNGTVWPAWVRIYRPIIKL